MLTVLKRFGVGLVVFYVVKGLLVTLGLATLVQWVTNAG